MRGLRRHEEKHGLDDDRRTLIHRYMVDADDSPEPELEIQPSQQPPESEPVEQSIDLAMPEPEAPSDPPPAAVFLHAVPPAPEPELREEGEFSLDAFRQTLEHVARLSEQVAEARDEGSRRREQLATHR